MDIYFKKVSKVLPTGEDLGGALVPIQRAFFDDVDETQ